MALSADAVKRRTAVFRKVLNRAHTLYARLVMNGYTDKGGATPQALRQPDRRDIAQFIFFETAAEFEALVRDLFLIEVRKRLVDSRQRALYVMGHSDYGVQGVHGWGDIKQVRNRATNLFGRSGFFARSYEILGSALYVRLTLAHRLRNRIAHPGPSTASAYRKALAGLGVPKRSRKGAGVGRVLVDYPLKSSTSDRCFHRLLDAYLEFANEADANL